MPQKFQQLKKSKKFSKSSKKWLLRQVNDQFVERARNEGWRSRSTFKIIEIDEKFKIFKKHKIVVDLGCAPGGWSQYCVGKVGEGNIVGIDLLPVSPIVGVNFMQLDFLTDEAPQKIIEELKKINHNKNGLCDIVLSDMAANTTGDQNTDHLRIIGLLEEALNLSQKILKNEGCFVGKIFQGGSSEEILNLLRQNFLSVKYFKPESSRKDSSETYLVACGFKNQNSPKEIL
jgi:23S rRNA (uridine2552-2'-O)-methyltransferase